MPRISQLLLRLAIAFAFLYVAYGFWANPGDWVGYLPALVKNIGLSQGVLLMILAGFHLIIGLWILSGWRIFLPSIVAALFLFGVVYVNRREFDELFRDVSIALAALALGLSSRGV